MYNCSSTADNLIYKRFHSYCDKSMKIFAHFLHTHACTMYHDVCCQTYGVMLGLTLMTVGVNDLIQQDLAFLAQRVSW